MAETGLCWCEGIRVSSYSDTVLTHVVYVVHDGCKQKQAAVIVGIVGITTGFTVGFTVQFTGGFSMAKVGRSIGHNVGFTLMHSAAVFTRLLYVLLDGCKQKHIIIIYISEQVTRNDCFCPV